MRSERRSLSIPKKILAITISILFLILQIVFYYLIFFGINDLKQFKYAYDIVYYFVEIIGICIVLTIYGREMNTGYKLSWTIFILLCPFLGTMSYLMFGNGRQLSLKKTLKVEKYLENIRPSDKSMEIVKKYDPLTYKFVNSVYRNSKFPPFINTDTTFFPDAYLKHKKMLVDMKNATKYIFLEYFIIADGKLLDEIIDVLKDKTASGVEVKILYDDVGTKPVLSKKTIELLKSLPNLEIYSYEPLGLNINPAVN